MLVLSHRGYHVDHPENTLEAFQAAIEMGVDGIETDIRLTSEGQTVLVHDHLTPDGRPVSSITHSELNRIVGITVPTLNEALELSVPDQFIWNLEVKTAQAIEATVVAIERWSVRRRMLVTSFVHPVIDEISKRVDVDCGLLVCHRPVSLALRPDWIPLHWRVKTLVWCWEFADADLIEQSQALGFHNYVYGISTPAEHAAAANWPLDGVITDRPEFLRTKK